MSCSCESIVGWWVH